MSSTTPAADLAAASVPPSAATQPVDRAAAPLRSWRAVGEVDPAHPGLRGERDELGPGRSRALAQAVAGSGQVDDAAALGGLVGQRGQLRGVGHLDHRGPPTGTNSDGLPVAEGDGAGLVQQQDVDVAGGLDGAPGHRQHVALDQPVHAGDADRRQQRADGRRDEADQQRDQDGDGLRRRRSRPRSGCRVTTASRKISVSVASRMFSATSFGVFCRAAPSTRAIIRSRKVSPGLLVIRMTIRSDSTLVPPVTAERSPPDSRMTGADSPVIGRLVDAGDARRRCRRRRGPPRRRDHDQVARAQLRGRAPRCRRVRWASRRSCLAPGAGCPPGPCRGPRPRPRRGWRTAR